MKNIIGILGWSARIVAILIGLMSLQDPSPVSADTATYSLEYPTTVREGTFVNVFLVRMTNHTHSQNFQARWETLTGTASEADYTPTTASQTSNDFQTLEIVWGAPFQPRQTH